MNYLGVPRTDAPATNAAKQNDSNAADLLAELQKTKTAKRAAETKVIELTIARDLYREEYRELQARLIGKV